MPQSALGPIKYSKNKIHCELYDFVGRFKTRSSGYLRHLTSLGLRIFSIL